MGISTVSYMLYRAHLIDYLGWMNQNEGQYSYDVCPGRDGGSSLPSNHTNLIGST